MAQIICLANSFKRGGRCIAGIDLATKKWIRPIGDGHEGAIGGERIIDGAEPELLDILYIPIGPLAIDHGCQPENVVLEAGKWSKVGKMSKQEVLKYVENLNGFLLHNHSDRIPLVEFENSVPPNRWKSLQLIRVNNAQFRNNSWGKLECHFRYNDLQYVLKAESCPEAHNYVNVTGDFLLCVSMGGPYRRNPEDELCCWKMVAGVIELD
jgi:hypothetical protein